MNKNKLILKIMALVAAVFLIGIIFFIANSFMGNPISAALANKAIKNYVSKEYSSLDLEVGKASYNFKFGEYMAMAKSKSSIDTHFLVYYKSGKVIRDDYEAYVVGKFNTLTRLENEYSKVIIPILSKIRGLENNRAMVQIEKWEYEKSNGTVKIDMSFDKNIPIDMKITIRADLENASLKGIAAILEEAHRVLMDYGCKFNTYDVFSEYKGVLVMISDVTPADIEGGKLEGLLQSALENRDNEEGKHEKKGSEDTGETKKINVYIRDGND